MSMRPSSVSGPPSTTPSRSADAARFDAASWASALRAGEHQAARGVAIEPVRERGRAQAERARRNDLPGFRRPWPLCTAKARWLVDDQHQPIAVDEARHHLFRCHDETVSRAGNMNDSTTRTRPARKAVKSPHRRIEAHSSALGAAITDVLMRGRSRLSESVEIEEALIRTDLGVDVADQDGGEDGCGPLSQPGGGEGARRRGREGSLRRSQNRSSSATPNRS